MICGQNGCENSTDSWNASKDVSTFCPSCCKKYGDFLRDHYEVMSGFRDPLIPRRTRRKVRDRFAKRLVEGFKMLDPYQDED